MKAFLVIILIIAVGSSLLCQVPVYETKVYGNGSHGFYFLSVTGPYKSTLLILDKDCNIVYYKPGTNGFNFSIQPNGLMSYADKNKFYLLDSTFIIKDSVYCKNIAETDKHDMRILPNGHYLMIGTESDTMDLSRYPYWHLRYESDTVIVRSSVIQEQDANRNVVFEWHSMEHFNLDDADTFLLTSTPGVLDWTHANSVTTDANGNLLLSTRNFSEITKISRQNGSIMWRLGGKLNQFRFVNCDVPFLGQHDIERLSNGHITLFDGGVDRIKHGARALEFQLDEINKVATLVWFYTHDSTLYSARQGNVQRLPNGNTLISYGVLLNKNISFVVVDSDGKKILQLAFKDTVNSYNVFNYPSLPWQLKRPQITCYDSLGVKYLDAGIYPSYNWSTGETSRSIKASVPGNYSVFVPYGEGGLVSSEKFVMPDVVGPCQIKK